MNLTKQIKREVREEVIGVKSPARLGILGLGEVILEYAYPGFMKLENEQGIVIKCVANTRSIDETIAKLEARKIDRPRERASIEDVLIRIHNEDRNIQHHQTDNGHFNEENAKKFLDEVDIVYLATPNNVRYELVKQIVEAGKGIILEKPIAHTTGLINDIVGTINRSDVCAICAEHYSYKDPSIEFYKTFREKTQGFGNILSIEGFLEENDFLDAERYKWLLDPSESGGGIWLDTGVHIMHLLYMTGARVANVKEATSYKYEFSGNKKSRNEVIKSETAADVYFGLKSSNGNFDNNANGHIRVSKCKQRPLKFFRVDFEKGEMFLDFLRNSIAYTDRTGPKTKYEENIVTKGDPYYNMMISFLDYFNGGVEPPTTMKFMKPSTDLVFEIYKQMKQGDPRQFY